MSSFMFVSEAERSGVYAEAVAVAVVSNDKGFGCYVGCGFGCGGCRAVTKSQKNRREFLKSYPHPSKKYRLLFGVPLRQTAI